MRRLYEKKDHLIRRNPNLKDGEKQEIIELLGKHPSYENKIDWSKNKFLTYEDFLSVLRPLYINDLDPRGLIEGIDYDILYDSGDEVLYSIYSYDASRILASNNVEPELWTKIPFWCGEEEKTDEAHAFGHFDSEHGDMKPGAKWCISMQTSDKHWNDYSPKIHFFFWFRNDDNLGDNRKIAISVSKETWEIAVLYNGADNKIEMELPSYITEAIDKEKEGYKEKEFNRVKFRLKLNPQTNRYDYDGSLNFGDLRNFISEDGDGFIINFGKITGDFDCFRLGLKSLKGAPIEVGRNFYCFKNQLTSLEGAPQKVGGTFSCHSNQLTSLKGASRNVGKNFICSWNQLTSLEGAPQKVGGEFVCVGNKLISLEGAPQKVGGNFDCSWNQLPSLEGAPQEVGEKFDCSWNQLTSLKGAPQAVGGDFCCYDTQLTSLKGAPQEVGGNFSCQSNHLTSLEGAPIEVGKDFDCSSNQLSSLEGAPQTVGESFNCSHNQLISLEGAPIEVGGNFYCSSNQLTTLVGAPQKVGKDFYCPYNRLPSLEGAPQKVGGNFCCHSNQLTSLEGIGEVKGKIIKYL